jgi:hypothetical protein
MIFKAYNFNMSENEQDVLVFDKEEIWKWLQIGIDKGWVSDPFCYTHDGDPYMSEEEEKEWEDGGDPCCPVLKILV